MKKTISRSILVAALLLLVGPAATSAEDGRRPFDLSKEEWESRGVSPRYEDRRLTQITLTAIPTAETIRLLAEIDTLKSVDVMLSSDEIGSPNAKSKFGDAELQALFRLSQIESLNLFSSNVSDRGMVGISSLKNLRALNLLGCKSITNDSLKELRALPQLVDVNLCFTSMSVRALNDDPIVSRRLEALGCPSLNGEAFAPGSWSNFTSLRRLTLVGIPSRSAVFEVVRLKQIESLDLELAHLSEEQTQRFASLNGLVEFTAPMSSLGRVLGDFRNCPNLRKLTISDRNMTIPNFGHITQLEELSLSLTSRAITASQAPAISNLINLKRLKVTGLENADLLIESAGSLPNLESIEVWDGTISPRALGELVKLKHLRSLSLPTLFFELTDEHLHSIGQMTNLRELPSMIASDISDDGIRALESLTHLEWLRLFDAKRLTDESVNTFVKMKQLKQLSIGDSSITPAGVERLRAALPTTEINIGSSE